MLMSTMAPMSTAHEQVHERARKNEKVGQIPERVREVLGPKQDAGDDQKGRADEKSPRRPEAS
jgi:hypothetical protein